LSRYAKASGFLSLDPEYSTIDTALCLTALRLAADVLHDDETATKALEMLREVNVSALRDADGYVIHGLAE
jgi:hypothetical protein